LGWNKEFLNSTYYNELCKENWIQLHSIQVTAENCFAMAGSKLDTWSPASASDSDTDLLNALEDARAQQVTEGSVSNLCS